MGELTLRKIPVGAGKSWWRRKKFYNLLKGSTPLKQSWRRWKIKKMDIMNI